MIFTQLSSEYCENSKCKDFFLHNCHHCIYITKNEGKVKKNPVQCYVTSQGRHLNNAEMYFTAVTLNTRVTETLIYFIVPESQYVKLLGTLKILKVKLLRRNA